MAAAVRLADAGPDGHLRPDGVARILQDVATDDWTASGLADTATWVVRQSALSIVGPRPRLGDDLVAETFCSGMGAAWAERRTDLLVDGELVIQACALWVPIDMARGRPQRVRTDFVEVYGESAAGRKISGRIASPNPIPLDADRRSWQLRRSDLDVVGHVNNAALWAALVEVAPPTITSAMLTHHGPVEGADSVELFSSDEELWLVVEGIPAVSAEWKTAGTDREGSEGGSWRE